jgi:hypothetical protein
VEISSCCLTNTIIAITADSKNGHEDAGRGELCVESWKRKTHFNTLGESGRVAGGRVETLYFSHRLSAERAERAEPFAEGLALGVIFDGRRPWHTRTRASLQRPHGIRLRRPRGFHLRRPHGFRLRRPHGALLRRPHGFHLRPPHGFCLWRPHGALDMLHRNEEHVLKSLHVD